MYYYCFFYYFRARKREIIREKKPRILTEKTSVLLKTKSPCITVYGPARIQSKHASLTASPKTVFVPRTLWYTYARVCRWMNPDLWPSINWIIVRRTWNKCGIALRPLLLRRTPKYRLPKPICFSLLIAKHVHFLGRFKCGFVLFILPVQLHFCEKTNFVYVYDFIIIILF